MAGRAPSDEDVVSFTDPAPDASETEIEDVSGPQDADESHQRHSSS